MTGRSHNVPAQATTLGKRFANAGEELLQALRRVEELLERYPLRGLKGPVGTQQDHARPARGRHRARLASSSGAWPSTSGSPQARRRRPGLPALARPRRRVRLVQAASGPANLAKTIRLMAGQELVTEGFQPGQVGSVRDAAQDELPLVRADQRASSRSSPATSRWRPGLVGDQWNEGDVSCSVVRRVMLPDAFLAIDGLFETFLTVLGSSAPTRP
jgi:adenylosuccinate lyase